MIRLLYGFYSFTLYLLNKIFKQILAIRAMLAIIKWQGPTVPGPNIIYVGSCYRSLTARLPSLNVATLYCVEGGGGRGAGARSLLF